MAAVAHDHEGVVINKGDVVLVELGSQVGFSDRQAYGTGDALTQGTRGDFDAGGFKRLGVAGGVGAPLAELLDVLDRHRVIAAQVQQGVKKHATVAGRQHEAIPVEPLGILGVVLQHPIPKGVGHGRSAHRQARVAGIRFIDRVDRQEANAVDAERVDGDGCGDHGDGRGREGRSAGEGTGRG